MDEVAGAFELPREGVRQLEGVTLLPARRGQFCVVGACAFPRKAGNDRHFSLCKINTLEVEPIKIVILCSKILSFL